MAIATRGDGDDAVEMIPNGMFASEKCDPRGILNQDRRGAMAVVESRSRLPAPEVSVITIFRCDLDFDAVAQSSWGGPDKVDDRLPWTIL
jgi:hypothetical protein